MDPISAVTLSQGTAPSATQVAQLDQAVSTPDASRGTTVNASEVARAAYVERPDSPVANAAGRVMNNIHSTVERMGRELDIVETAAPSPAEEAKSALTPASGDLAPGGPVETSSVAEGRESNIAMLNKSFDHAMFMAMVNQVISGVGDSSRTLIRQA